MANINKIQINNVNYDLEDTVARTTKVSFDSAQTLTDPQKAQARTNIGALGADAVEGVVKYNATQTIEETDKARARTNIGAASSTDLSTLADGVVRFDTTQSLSPEQQDIARNNLGVTATPVMTGYVKYDDEQTLSPEEQSVARANIGALSENDLPVISIEGAIRWDIEQELDQGQQELARTNINAASVDDIEMMLTYSDEQTLSAADQAQARANIGAASASDVATATSGMLKYTEQTLTPEQQAQARTNIGVTGATGAVKYDSAQNLSAQEQEQARTNIGALGTDDLSSIDLDGAVLYDEAQALSSEEKTMARTNIGAAASSDLSNLVASVSQTAGTFTITKQNGTTSTFNLNDLPTGLAFDGGYVDASDNTLHLTDGGVDIDGYEPIQLPIGGPASAEYDSSYYLHFYDASGNEMLGGPFLIEGGGGGVSGYSVRIINNTGSTTFTAASTQRTFLNFTYREYYGSEIEASTGLLTVQYKLATDNDWRNYITNRQIPSNIAQQIEITDLLTEDNTTNVRLVCSNGRSGDDAQSKTLVYNVSSVSISISSSFNSAATYRGNLTIPYTCVGRGIEKTVYLYIDGYEYTHVDVGTSHNRAMQMTVELTGNYSYGAHTARLYFITSEGAYSNTLTFPIMYDNGTSDDPIIGATLADDVIENGETLLVKYVTYTPGSETTSNVTITVYAMESGSRRVYYTNTNETVENNVEQSLPISSYPPLGNAYVELVSGNTATTLTFEVTEVQTDYEITPVTTGLVYSYKPTGYTNNTSGKESYVYHITDAAGQERDIHTTFDGFNWVTDGYLDSESLTLAGSARMNIELPLFTTSFRNSDNQIVTLDAASGATVTTSGRTIEFEFSLNNVTDQNSVVFSCQDANGVGLVITPQVCYLCSHGQAPVFDSTGFIENEESIPCAYIKDEKRIRISFVIQRIRRVSGRFVSYVNIFINGEYANSYLYSEDASYGSSATITIGSNDCVTKLYEIRAYNRDLDDSEILRNRMNSHIDIRQRILQNEYNDVLDDNGEVSYAKARYKYPCLLFIGNLSNTKSDKQNVGVVLTKPNELGDFDTEFSLLDKDNSDKFLSSIKVQGTSSQRFMRKNFKVALVKDNGDGSTSKVKYVLKGYDDNDNPLSIGESTLCFKMDYMSTDHANTFNANIADTLFNDKPAGSLVQNTVWGFRCLLFNMAAANYQPGVAFENYPDGVIQFAGDGCLNNDKSNSKSFGLETNGDNGNVTTQQKWEFKDNSNPLCSFKTDRLMQKIYDENNNYILQARNGLESCYPDEGDLDDAGISPEYKYIQILYSWVYQRANFWDANGRSGSGGTYNGQSYSSERELKKAIFKREFTRHFNLEHALVYYLFIEWVALCDNRAKNMFLSCKNLNAENIVFRNGATSVWDCVNMETGEVDISKIDWDNSTFGIWYTDLYDLDSCFGAENSGYIRIPYYADWNYVLGRTGTYQFNGHDSRLWCMFEEAFADEIKARAQILTRNNNGAGTLNHAVLRQVHITDNAELVCPAIINEDMEYKYEDAWTEGYYDYSIDADNPPFVYTNAYKYLQRGSRTEQKESFIYRRSMMLYSKYQCDQFLNDQILFRCGEDVNYSDTRLTLSAVQSMWLGVSYGDSGNPQMSTKKAAGETATITSPNSIGHSDHIHIHGASNLTSISSLSAFHPYEIGLTNAGKLKTLLIGSNAAGYSNGQLTGLDTSACALLDTLNVQGCTGFTDTPINLSSNTLIREVYAGGSTVPYFIFANGGILEKLELGTPRRIMLLNQAYMNSLTYDSLSNLELLRIENTPNTGVLNILNDNLDHLNLGVRLIGLDETIEDMDTSLFKKLTSSSAKGKRLDANGNLVNDPEAYPVITGTIHCGAIGRKTLELMNTYYPDLVIDADQTIPQYTATFLNKDGSAILDRNGNPYVQFVDSGSHPTDPVASGEIDAPTCEPDSQYVYTYSGWADIISPMTDDRNVVAQYTQSARRYTVSFYDGIGAGDGTLLERITNVAYGAQVIPTDPHPTYTEMEGNNIYYVHSGWDKSTGFITEDTIVHATWITGSLPTVGTKTLDQMNVAEIRAIAKNRLDATYWQPMDHVDITLGRDFNYSNVDSEMLVSEPIFLDGTAPIVFNGQNGRPMIQLFSADAPSFTLAIDYEFYNTSGALVSCYNPSDYSGFYLGMNNGNPSVFWANRNTTVGAGYQRGIVVLRHRQGTNILYIDHSGNTSSGIYPNGSNSATNCAEIAINNTLSTTITNPLTIGGVGYTNGADMTDMRAVGWIHWCKIWYQDLGQNDGKAIANFPHEKIRMLYTPIKYISAGTEEGQSVNASFVSEAALPWRKTWSYVNSWLNGQFFDALPCEWQSIIATSIVRTTQTNGTTTSQSLKLYMPSRGEVVPGNASSYPNETDLNNRTIPWMTTNLSRATFAGWVMPDDVRYITSSDDPSMYTQSIPIESCKTIWNNGNRRYVYVDAEYASKHRYLCGGTLISSSTQAAGVDGNGNSGGRWVKCVDYWMTRSYGGTGNSYPSMIDDTGNASTYNTSNPQYYLRYCYAI